MPDCVVTGTLLKSDNTLGANQHLSVVKVVKAGALYLLSPISRQSNSSGVVSFTVPQSSTAYVYSNAVGLSENGMTGVALAIPASATANLEDLIAVASVPSTGLTVRDNGTVLPSLIGDFDFVGFTVEHLSSGVARLTNPGGGSAHNLLSATHPDTTAATATRGDIIIGQGASAKWARKALGASGQYLRSDGTDLLYSVIQAADLPSAIDAARIGAGNVSNTEFDFLNGVTSSIQDQINAQLTQAEADALYSLLAHNHSGVYEPANANIQSHISSTANPHAVTKSQVGLGNVDNVQQQPLSARLSELATIGTALQVPRVNAAGNAIEYHTPSGGGGGSQTPWTSNIDADGFDLLDLGNIQLQSGKSLLDANNNELLKFSQTASAINELTITNAAAGGEPRISATGGDSDISIQLAPKGGGRVTIVSGGIEFDGDGGPRLLRAGNYVSLGVNSPVIVGGSDSGAKGIFLGANDGVYFGSGNPNSSGNDAALVRDLAAFLVPTDAATGAGGFALREVSANPADPTADVKLRMYLKADKMVIQFNNATTVRYFTLDLTQSSATPAWAQSTTPP